MILHRFPIIAAAATVAALTMLSACGGGELYGECQPPSAGTIAEPIAGPRPVVYGTGAPWFSGPLQAAPAEVTAAANLPLVVCP